MNQVNISGRLGKDPELKTTTNGHTVTAISVAVYNGKDREPIWVPVVAFNKVAEFICQHLRKGDPIEVAGRLRVDSYTDKDGNQRSRIEVEGRDVSFPPSQKREEARRETNSTAGVQGYQKSQYATTGQNRANTAYAVVEGTPSDQYAGFADAADDELPF